jgi:hypothetical protein
VPEKDDPAAPAGGEPDPFTPPDDPFADAFGPAPSGPAPLAHRDPDAPLDESAEYLVAGATSIDDVLRRARRQGFLAGTAAGALAAAAVAVALALFTSSSGVPTREGVAEPRVVEVDGAREGPPGRSAWRSRPTAAKPVPPAPPRRDDRPEGAAEAPPPLPRAPVAEATVPPVPEPAAADPSPSGTEPDAGEAPSEPEPEEAAARPVDAREVAAALRARRDELEACVASTPGDPAAARGQDFWISLVIAPTGEVSDARIDDPEIEATPLGACLVRLARTMSFAPFEGSPASVKLALEYGSSQ